MDEEALTKAETIFKNKIEIVPVKINRIAQDGGALNCISWEL